MRRRSRLFPLGTTLALCALGSIPALAGAPRTHDGFFLRLSGGPGYASPSLDYLDSNLKLSGSSGDLNLAVGGMVSPNLALHGTLLSWVVSNPDVSWGGPGSVRFDGDLSMAAIGAGLTYYFMPANIYASGSVGFGSLTLDAAEGLDGETKDGPVVDLTLGKEWWVGNSWGLGAALAFGYHSFPEKQLTTNWTGGSLALRFSATLN